MFPVRVFSLTLPCASPVCSWTPRYRMLWKVAALLSLVLGSGALPTSVDDDPEDGGKHWVVIVAGSNGWYNYRHQVRR